MAGITVSIIPDKLDKTYEGGETIAGRVRVVVTEDVRPAALIAVLYCKGYSEKKTRIAGPEIARMEREIEEKNLFKGSWTPGANTPILLISRHPPVLGLTMDMFLISLGISDQKRALPGGRRRMSRPKRASSSSLGKGHLKVRGEKAPKRSFTGNRQEA